MKDPQFCRGQKANLDINLADGAELEENVRKVFNSTALTARLKEILK
jgi:hypothetical protein